MDGKETYLGLSGINIIPVPNMVGQMIPSPTTVRQGVDPEAGREAIEKQSVREMSRNGNCVGLI